MMQWNRFYDATVPLYKEACNYLYKKPCNWRVKSVDQFYELQKQNKETLMLILARRINQKIFIGEEIQIVLIEADYRFAKIGIEAPQSIFVHREEVYLKNLREEINHQQQTGFKRMRNLSTNGGR